MAEIALTTLVDSEQSLRIQTPLGDQVLQIRTFHGIESLSQPFEYTAHVISTDRGINFDDILGQSVMVSYATEKGIRYFHGIVGEIEQQETPKKNDDATTLYVLKFYPQLWLLKYVTDCRIFQNISVMDIVKILLQENNVVYVDNKVMTAGQSLRDYCVQYNESCFDFINRILAEEGIYYYFAHNENQHTLVLGDEPNAHQPCPEDQSGQFYKGMTNDYPPGIVYDCHRQQRVTISGRGLADYNFTTATTPLYAHVTDKGVGGLAYTYPGSVDAENKPTQSLVESLTKTNFERERIEGSTLNGQSTQAFFTAGHLFTLEGYDRPGSDGEYVLYAVTHTCTANSDPHQPGQNIYHNEFQAFSVDIPFQPPLITARPPIHSVQTAWVTGPEGEEIWTDDYGRIKVKFHWDTLGPHAGKSDDKSSCWIRVAEGWAGNNWGMLFTPRTGMEVVVTFLNGNPDRPLVTGCVWNSKNRPPYLPKTPTKSTIKSRSTPKAEDNEYNEFRYDDLRGSEQVYMRAQKDLDTYIRQTQTHHVEAGSQWTWIDRGDCTMTLLAQENAVAKTTPAGQDLPKGQGNLNVELTGGNVTIDQLSVHDAVTYNHYIVKGDYNQRIDEGNVFHHQGQGDILQQWDQGHRSSVLKKGHDTLIVEQGDHNTYLRQGDINTQLDKGDHTTLLKNGDHLSHLHQGERVKIIDNGGDYEVIKQGPKMTTLRQGDHTLKINQGDQSITLVQGNRKTELLAGNDSHIIDGNRETTVTRNDTLTITGGLTIEVTGPISIVSESVINMTGQNINLTATEGITMNAGATIIMDAGVDISQRAGMNIDIESGMNMTLASGIDINASAGAAVTIESVLDTNIAAGLEVSIEAAGSATLTGGGAVEIIGATVTLITAA